MWQRKNFDNIQLIIWNSALCLRQKWAVYSGVIRVSIMSTSHISIFSSNKAMKSPMLNEHFVKKHVYNDCSNTLYSTNLRQTFENRNTVVSMFYKVSSQKYKDLVVS